MTGQRLTRRECLTRGAGAVVGAAVAAAGGYLLYDPQGDAGLPRSPDLAPGLKNYFEAIDFPAAAPRLSLALGDEQRIEQITRAAVCGLDPQRGMRRFIAAGDVVLIKPNAGFDRPPYLGATTHPAVLRAVIRMCREAGAREVLVTDNPIESPAACFSKTGIDRAVAAEGARLVLPAPHRFAMLKTRDHAPDPQGGEALGRWPVLYEPLARATKLIGIAPVKDHNLASASIVLKNWYGLLGGRRNQFHQAIHAVISDLALLISPTLVIADATRVMLQNGPTGGRISDVAPGGKLGRPTVVAAVDPVACDAWCYQNLLGRDPAQLPYLELAARKIRAAVAAGQKRLGQHDWRAYEREGQITSSSL